jgi:hypothetical protein
MQHVQPCSFCGGVVKISDNHWQCKRCEAEWTLGMRLLREGNVLGKTLDDVLGTNDLPDDNLRVDTLHQATGQRYRVRIYTHDGADVVILSALSGHCTMEDGDAVRAVRDIYGLADATYVLHLPHEQSAYMLMQPVEQRSLLYHVVAVEEVERITGAFFGDEEDEPDPLPEWLDALS